jgi:type II restriction enzyme
MKEKFKIDDLYKYEEEFQKKHPNNNNIRPKLRQILQLLRDKGLIKFEEPGCYKKLFK